MTYRLPRSLGRAPRTAANASILAAVALASPVGATWKPEYANQPFEVQQWYRNAELTKAAQVRFPFKKCCDHSDVVKTKFNVNRTSSGDEWYWLDGDTWRRIPDDIIHWQEHAPNGQPTFHLQRQGDLLLPGRWRDLNLILPHGEERREASRLEPWAKNASGATSAALVLLRDALAHKSAIADLCIKKRRSRVNPRSGRVLLGMRAG